MNDNSENIHSNSTPDWPPELVAKVELLVEKFDLDNVAHGGVVGEWHNLQRIHRLAWAIGEFEYAFSLEVLASLISAAFSTRQESFAEWKRVNGESSPGIPSLNLQMAEADGLRVLVADLLLHSGFEKATVGMDGTAWERAIASTNLGVRHVIGFPLSKEDLIRYASRDLLENIYIATRVGLDAVKKEIPDWVLGNDALWKFLDGDKSDSKWYALSDSIINVMSGNSLGGENARRAYIESLEVSRLLAFAAASDLHRAYGAWIVLCGEYVSEDVLQRFSNLMKINPLLNTVVDARSRMSTARAIEILIKKLNRKGE